MARIALTRNDRTEFVPSGYDSGESPPTFIIVPLTGDQRHEVNAVRASGFSGEANQDAAKFDLSAYVRAMLLAAKYGLRDWRHVEGEQGEPVEFPEGPKSMPGLEAVRLLPSSIAQEIGAAVVERSNLTEDQRGN